MGLDALVNAFVDEMIYALVCSCSWSCSCRHSWTGEACTRQSMNNGAIEWDRKVEWKGKKGTESNDLLNQKILCTSCWIWRWPPSFAINTCLWMSKQSLPIRWWHNPLGNRQQYLFDKASSLKIPVDPPKLNSNEPYKTREKCICFRSCVLQCTTALHITGARMAER